ncbi:MAG: flippase [Theionarchaea archaeon]|nr:flippase [Theionarchaea archaeon]MBU7001007.1 flippase [Theionarchaea archaeon]MBU7020496.1 flippase [Theionarchaea archaeon]MBU7034461.1 flippase [Theionarchaea archaeon]MBU7039790.1 flippase [Theionarchaea archaeon]
MDRSSRLARHTFNVFMAMFAIGFVRYFYKISMARMLDVRGYGLVSAVEPVIIITASFTLTGFAAALSKYLSEEIAMKNMKTAQDYLATAMYYLFPLSLIVTIIIFAAASPIAGAIFREPDLGILIRIVVLVMPVEALWLIIDGIFLGYQESPFYTYSLLVYNLAVLVIAIVLVSLGMGTEGAVIGILLGDISGLIAAYMFYKRKFKGKLSLTAGSKSFQLLRKLIDFAVPKTITSVSMMILMSFDIFCITYFLGVTDAGLYNAAVPIARIMTSVSSSVALPLLPAVSEDMAREKGYVGTYLCDALKYTSGATFPLTILFVIYAEELIRLFFGAEYAVASTALMVLSLAMFFMSFCSIFSVTFQGMGKPKVPMHITVFALLLNILLNVYLIPKMGINGAAFATLASMSVQFFYLSIRMKDFAYYSPVKSDIFKIACVSMGVLLMAVLFRNRMIIGAGLGMGFYVLCIVAFKIIDIRKFLFDPEPP